MSAPLAPASVKELVEVVLAHPRVLALGAGTKPRLTQLDVTKVSTLQLQGIVEYEPSEFTFTALAGTPLREVTEALAARGQYLPFDPLWVEAGATLGGTVASGVSGPGRLRFGGLRDFILGVRFVDGSGRALRMGGKVVKNAAGFDLPKFFVGSLGRFGVLAELTFKVFPAPAGTLTLLLAARDMEEAARIQVEAARARWDTDALEILHGGCDVLLRLAGPAQALEELSKDVLSRWPGKKLTDAQGREVWAEVREVRWAHAESPLVKAVLTPAVLPALHQALRRLDGVRLHVSSGGNVAFISLPAAEQAVELGGILQDLCLSGLMLRGEGPLWCGAARRPKIAQAVKDALDPEKRFPGLDE